MNFFRSEDDDEGLIDRLGNLGGGSPDVDTERIWDDVREEGRDLDRQASKLSTKADNISQVEGGELADPQEIAEYAEEAAEDAENLAIGARTALDVRSESTLSEDEMYEKLDSIHGKLLNLAESVDEAYEEARQYGEETYEQFREILADEDNLDVDIELPGSIDWDERSEISQAFRDARTAYNRAEMEYQNEAKKSSNEQKQAED